MTHLLRNRNSFLIAFLDVCMLTLAIMLADAIKTILAWHDNQRKVMSEKAKKRAAEFTWYICAEKTVAVLVRAVRR